MQTRDVSPRAFAPHSREASRNAMQLWSADPDQQVLMERLGAAGTADTGGTRSW